MPTPFDEPQHKAGAAPVAGTSACVLYEYFAVTVCWGCCPACLGVYPPPTPGGLDVNLRISLHDE